jgi:hypothetical protein
MNRGSSVRPLVIWLVCSLLGPNPLPSQQRVAAGDWNRVRNLPPGTPIWIKTKAGAAYHGKLISATSEAVRLESDERSFPGRTTRRRDLRQEDVLEIRRFSRRGSALAGAGIGAGVGAGIGLAVDFSARSNEDRGLATVLFALLGSLFGWGVGRHSTLIKGDTLYTAP